MNENKSADWLGSLRASAIAWWIPQGVMIVAIFAPVSVRAWVWVAVLVWMGAACILNSRRCGRVHCRFDGYCALCSGWAQFVLRHDPTGKYRLLPAQSALGGALYVQGLIVRYRGWLVPSQVQENAHAHPL